MAATAASDRASTSVAAPEAAPVRMAVRLPPSMSATGAPLVASTAMTTEWMSGRPRPVLLLKTETSFNPSAPPSASIGDGT